MVLVPNGRKTVRDEVIEYLEKVGCARFSEIFDAVGTTASKWRVYQVLNELEREGYVVPKIDFEYMRRRIYCINKERKPLVRGREVKLELPA